MKISDIVGKKVEELNTFNVPVYMNRAWDTLNTNFYQRGYFRQKAWILKEGDNTYKFMARGGSSRLPDMDKALEGTLTVGRFYFKITCQMNPDTKKDYIDNSSKTFRMCISKLKNWQQIYNKLLISRIGERGGEQISAIIYNLVKTNKLDTSIVNAELMDEELGSFDDAIREYI